MTTAFVVAGIGYGDEGKGTITDALVRRHGAGLVVRYNGGAQAAHNVVTPDGVHHTFAQFGAGAFAGAGTYIGEHVVVDPPALINEYYALVSKGAYTQIAIHPNALLVNPYQIALNRIREQARGDHRHGSTGKGIGECVCDSKRGLDVNIIRAADILRPGVLTEKLQFWRERKMQDAGEILRAHRDSPLANAISGAIETWFGAATPISASWLARTLACANFVTFAEPHAVLPHREVVVFEGAQGVLLDEKYGFHPYSTWSDVTFKHALAMLKDTASAWDIRRIGVTRAYATRHGFGPMPTEQSTWRPPRGEHNQDGYWQGPMRYGHFDLVAADYAIDVLGGIDELAVTCIDHLPASKIPYAVSYRDDNGQEIDIDVLRTVWAATALQDRPVTPVVGYQTADDANSFCDAISAHLGTPITIRSFGPTCHEKGWSR